MPVGMYDPDQEETSFQKKALKGKTELQKTALAACHRTYFKSTSERARFRRLEEKARGATPEDIMFFEWIKHNINLAVIHNKKIMTRTFSWLMSACENEARCVDWIVANREKIMKDRAKSVENMIFGE